MLILSEGRRIGKRNGKHSAGKERSQTMRRVWHVAETEESCGNYSELMSEEKPADLCKETSTEICICTGRENTSEDNSVTEQPQWQFKCGTCEFRWSVKKDETPEEEKGVEKKAKKDKKKKLSKVEKKRKEERTKMRKKLKEKKAKNAKKESKKNSDTKAAKAQPRSEE